MAPADWEALPFTRTAPLIMFSATPVPALPSIVTVGALVHARRVVADVAVDRDLDVGVQADRDVVRACGIVDDDLAVRPGACSAEFTSRSGVVDRSKVVTVVHA